MATDNISTFTKQIEANCMNKWRKVAAKAPSMALVGQAEVRKASPLVTGTLRRGMSVEPKLVGTLGIEFHFKTSVVYFWCVNYGGPCPRGQSRTPKHFFEQGVNTAIPLMVAIAKGV
jgi:hypothetical protein